MKTQGPDEKEDVMKGIMGTAEGEIKQQLVNMVSKANDISGLVRKKPDSDSAESSQPAKKQKGEEEEEKEEQ